MGGADEWHLSCSIDIDCATIRLGLLPGMICRSSAGVLLSRGEWVAVKTIAVTPSLIPGLTASASRPQMPSSRLAISLSCFWLACLAATIASAASNQADDFQGIPTDDMRPGLAVLKSAQFVPQECICPMVYDPVCGRPKGGSHWATYPNSCQARCAGATEIKKGPC